MAKKSSTDLVEFSRLYHQAAANFNTAVKQLGYVPDDIPRAALEASHLCFLAYLQQSNWPSDKEPIENIPRELAAAVSDWLGTALSGKVPAMFQHVARAGSPALLPREAKGIGLAVAYLKLCESRTIQNRAPTKTVAEAFGVHPRTVRRWKTEFSWVRPENFFPELSSSARTAKITASLLSEADLYRRAGRGETGRFEHPRPGKRRVSTARADTTK